MNINEQVKKYIVENWKKTVRLSQESVWSIKLPYPFSVPCADERFVNFFYWDTYFANLGLLIDNPEQAKNNLMTMKFLVNTLGYIPNSSLKVTFNRSQPPLYISAVYDYYKVFSSIDIVEDFYDSMVKEYEFWMKNRITECGLNQYNSSATEKEIYAFVKEVATRGILKETDDDAFDKAKNLFAEAESGWDFTPRFKGKALDYVQVDLNSILYKNETILAEFATLLKKSEEAHIFKEKAFNRKQRMEKLMKDENGIYRDYDFKNKELSSIVSVASVLPYWANISNEKETCKKVVDKLEYSYGISACEKCNTSIFQWDYPNMWPPLVYFTVIGLINVGAIDNANRISQKYLNTVANKFATDGCLYEKYSVLTGDYSVQEYVSPKMLGWTAGVFRFLQNTFD